MSFLVSLYHLPVTIRNNSFPNLRSTFKVPGFHAKITGCKHFSHIFKIKTGSYSRKDISQHLYGSPAWTLGKAKFYSIVGLTNFELHSFVDVIWWWKVLGCKRKNLRNSSILLLRKCKNSFSCLIIIVLHLIFDLKGSPKPNTFTWNIWNSWVDDFSELFISIHYPYLQTMRSRHRIDLHISSYIIQMNIQDKLPNILSFYIYCVYEPWFKLCVNYFGVQMKYICTCHIKLTIIYHLWRISLQVNQLVIARVNQ